MTHAEFLKHLAVVDPLLWYYARRLERTRGVPAEDLMQHARLTLWADRGKATGHPSPSHWFAQAAKWAMWKLVRAEALRWAMTIGEADDRLPGAVANLPAPAAPEPDEFDTLIRLLAPPVAEVVRRRFAVGETHDQVAAALGVCSATVKNRSAKAYARVRAAVGG